MSTLITTIIIVVVYSIILILLHLSIIAACENAYAYLCVITNLYCELSTYYTLYNMHTEQVFLYM